MSTIIFDTETTGLKDPVIVEAAWLLLSDPLNLTIEQQFEARYNPGKPIELGAMSIHHIRDEDVADCLRADEFSLPEGTQYIIGHNVDYDWKAIGKPPVKRICTLALSRHIYPDLDSHTQSAMLYSFERDLAKDLLKGAHSAMADVLNCRLVLDHLINWLRLAGRFEKWGDWEDLWILSEQARTPTRMAFGKHKGELLTAIPSQYRDWLLRQSDVDPYLLKALA